MKAIFFPIYGYPRALEQINRELKDCKKIIKEISTGDGYILIIDNISRKDKLKRINEITK